MPSFTSRLYGCCGGGSVHVICSGPRGPPSPKDPAISDSVVALHCAIPGGQTSSASIATAVSTALGVHFALGQASPDPPKDTEISNTVVALCFAVPEAARPNTTLRPRRSRQEIEAHPLFARQCAVAARLEWLDIGTSGAYPSGQTETTAPSSSRSSRLTDNIQSSSSIMLTRDGVTEGAAAAPGVNPGACSTAFITPFLSLSFSLAVTFPVTKVTDHLCIGVRRGFLLLVLALALALALALLPLAPVDSADVHRHRPCQCAAGHDDASDLLSHKRIR